MSKEQLKFDVKMPISFEADQKCDSPMSPLNKKKSHNTVNLDPKKFFIYYLCFEFKIELNTATQEDKQQDSIDEEIKAEIKGFFCYREIECRNWIGKSLKIVELKQFKIPTSCQHYKEMSCSTQIFCVF